MYNNGVSLIVFAGRSSTDRHYVDQSVFCFATFCWGGGRHYYARLATHCVCHTFLITFISVCFQLDSFMLFSKTEVLKIHVIEMRS